MLARFQGNAARPDWTFEYPAIELIRALQGQLTFRKERVDFWKAESERLMGEIKTSGLEFSESVDVALSAYLSNNAPKSGPQLKINDELKDKYVESQNKIKEHGEMIKIIESWLNILVQEDDNRMFPLKFDDWEFFFNGPGTPNEFRPATTGSV